MTKNEIFPLDTVFFLGWSQNVVFPGVITKYRLFRKLVLPVSEISTFCAKKAETALFQGYMTKNYIFLSNSWNFVRFTPALTVSEINWHFFKVTWPKMKFSRSHDQKWNFPPLNLVFFFGHPKICPFRSSVYCFRDKHFCRKKGESEQNIKMSIKKIF